jgi:hypothetical protein
VCVVIQVLDILRRVVLIESAAEHYARMAAGSGGSMERVLGLLADGSGSGLGGVLMGVRFLANCFYHRSTRKLLAGHVTVRQPATLRFLPPQSPH